jgi:hypothetical protein
MFPNKQEILEEKFRLLRNFRFVLSGFLIVVMSVIQFFLLVQMDKGIFDIAQMLTISVCIGLLSGFSASKISDAYVHFLNNKFDKEQN